MNVGQLRRTLEHLERIYRDSGDTKRARLLATFSNLLDGDQDVPIVRFVQQIGNAWQLGPLRKRVRADARGRRERAHMVK